jgi:hypothetical protein
VPIGAKFFSNGVAQEWPAISFTPGFSQVTSRDAHLAETV